MVQNTCYPPKDKRSNYEPVQLGQALGTLICALNVQWKVSIPGRGELKKKKRLGDSSMISKESKQAGMVASDWETM